MSGMRKLKYHEQKLLKKTDFLNWKKEKNIREIKVLRRYHIHDREDYVKYNKTYVFFFQFQQIPKISKFIKCNIIVALYSCSYSHITTSHTHSQAIARTYVTLESQVRSDHEIGGISKNLSFGGSVSY